MWISVACFGQANYQYQKGDVPKVVIKMTNLGKYVNTSKGNRGLVNGRWMYFKTDSLVITRVPPQNLNVRIVHGGNVSAKNCGCSSDVIINLITSQSCILFLGRSDLREQ